MADGGTIAQRITDLIGSEYSTNAAYAGDFINAAINEIADVLPPPLLLKYSPVPLPVTSSSGVSMEGKKVLEVSRVDADSSGIERICQQVDRRSFSQGKDSTSIHYATVFNPIFHIDTNTGTADLLIYPDCNSSGQAGKIWVFTYVANGADTTGVTGALLNSDYVLPSELIHAVSLKSSVNLLSSYISNSIQDDEDTEIVQMLTAQVASLQGQYEQEMTRFVGEKAE